MHEISLKAAKQTPNRERERERARSAVTRVRAMAASGQPELLSVKPVEKEQSQNASLLDLEDVLQSEDAEKQKPVEKIQVQGETYHDTDS